MLPINISSTGDVAFLSDERLAHEAYAATRRQVFVEQPETLWTIDEYVATGGSPLVISGETGSGKSALVAYWHHRSTQADSGKFVLPHFVGASPAGCESILVIRRILMELKERYAISETIPTDESELCEALPQWLAQVQGERMIIFIDGLNQLSSLRLPASMGKANQSEAASIAWLPDFLPPNVRLVVTTTPGSLVDDLTDRNWRLFTVSPLSRQQRLSVINAFLTGQERKLNEKHLRRMTSGALFSNPLFLRTSLEEVRRAPSSRTATEQIDRLLECQGLDELFGCVLHRIETEYGRSSLGEVASLLYGARRGLSYDELQHLIQPDDSWIKRILVSLSSYLIERQDVLSFFHEQMRLAVRTRYVDRPETLGIIHRRIADGFSRLMPSRRRAEEEPWGWLNAQEFTRLEECIGSIEMFSHLTSEGMEYDLASYWRAVDGLERMPERYRQQLSDSVVSTIGIEPSEALIQMAQFFEICGELDAAQSALIDSVSMRSQRSGDMHTETAAARSRLARLLIERGRLTEAESLCQSVVAIQRSQLGETDPATIDSLRNLGMLLHQQGRFNEAEPILKQVHVAIESRMSGHHPAVASALQELAMPTRALGEYEIARQLLTRAVSIVEEAHGSEHPSVASMMTELATLLDEMARPEEAIALHRRALSVREQILGCNHTDTAQSYNNLGSLLRRTGQSDESAQYLRAAHRIYHKHHGDHHPSTVATLTNLAILLRDRGELDEARPMFEKALAVSTTILGETHPSTALILAHLGDLLLRNGQLDEAEAAVRRSLELIEQAVGTEHSHCARAQLKLSELLLLKGIPDEACLMAGKALATFEDEYGATSLLASTAGLHLAQAQFTLGKREIARERCQQIIETRGTEDESPVIERTRRLLALIDKQDDPIA